MNELIDGLYRKLKRKKNVAAFVLALLLLCFPLTVVLAILWGAAGFAGFALMIAFFFLYKKLSDGYGKLYKENVVKRLTLDRCDFLENAAFDPDDGLSDEEIAELDVMGGSRYSANDLITAEYRAKGFRQSDVLIEGGDRNDSTYFRGRMIVFDAGAEWQGEIRILGRHFAWVRAGNRPTYTAEGTELRRVSFADDAFEREFEVFASYPEEVQRILTPEAAARLVSLREAVNAPMCYVLKNGKCYVGINNQKDAFEPKVFGKLNFEEDQAAVLRDLRTVTDIADALFPSV